MKIFKFFYCELLIIMLSISLMTIPSNVLAASTKSVPPPKPVTTKITTKVTLKIKTEEKKKAAVKKVVDGKSSEKKEVNAVIKNVPSGAKNKTTTVKTISVPVKKTADDAKKKATVKDYFKFLKPGLLAGKEKRGKFIKNLSRLKRYVVLRGTQRVKPRAVTVKKVAAVKKAMEEAKDNAAHNDAVLHLIEVLAEFSEPMANILSSKCSNSTCWVIYDLTTEDTDGDGVPDTGDGSADGSISGDADSWAAQDTSSSAEPVSANVASRGLDLSSDTFGGTGDEEDSDSFTDIYISGNEDGYYQPGGSTLTCSSGCTVTLDDEGEVEDIVFATADGIAYWSPPEDQGCQCAAGETCNNGECIPADNGEEEDETPPEPSQARSGSMMASNEHYRSDAEYGAGPEGDLDYCIDTVDDRSRKDCYGAYISAMRGSGTGKESSSSSAADDCASRGGTIQCSDPVGGLDGVCKCVIP